MCLPRSRRNEPGGTSRASSPASSDLSRALLPPPLRSVRWSPAPPGAACGRSIGHERGAPVRPAPARHAVRPLRSRPASRARPGVTGGDPAAPGRLPATPQPRAAGCADACRAARGSARPLALLGLRLALLRLRSVALGRVRKARRSRCPRARPGLPGRGAARGHQHRLDRPDCVGAGMPARTPPASLHRSGRFRAAVADRSG